MARIKLPSGDAPESHRLLGLNKEMGAAIANLSIAIYEQSPLDKRVREAVRMRIALINDCQICLAYRFPEFEQLGIDEAFYEAINHWQSSDLFSEKEKLAIEYAEKFALDHLSLDDDFFRRLHQHFSHEDIFVLTASIGGLMANGRMMQVLQVEQSCSLHFNETL